ncbi:MAG: hypothetical protein RPS47_12720 [Colwellia sp.]|jgi:hypothetical protein
MIDRESPEINKRTQVIAYLRDWANGWDGDVELEIRSVSESFINPVLARIAEKLEGQVIRVKNNKSVFKR